MRKVFLILCTSLCAMSLCAAQDRNVTVSPDGKMCAFTRDNDLWIRSVSDSVETRITYDGIMRRSSDDPPIIGHFGGARILRE